MGMQRPFPEWGGVLLEQWIGGIEYPVDSYILDGICTTLAIGQYHPFSINGVFSSYETIWPAKISKETEELILSTNNRLVSGSGLLNGRTHAEYIVSGGKCYLVEIGARGGGSFFSSDDVRYVSGFCTEDFLLDFALGKPIRLHSYKGERHRCCCTLFFYLPENGIVESIDGLKYVMELPFTRRNNLDQIHVGLKTRRVDDKGARYFTVVVAESYEQLNLRVQNIRENLRISTVMRDGVSLPIIWR